MSGPWRSAAGATQIEVADLPPEIVGAGEAPLSQVLVLPAEGLDFDAYIGRIEHELISRALEQSAGNKGHAARLLNLKRTTLVEKLKRLERLEGRAVS